MLSREVIVNGRCLSRRMTGIERYVTEILRCLGDRVRIVHPGKTLQGVAGHAWEQFSLPASVSPHSILWSPANTGPLAVSNQVLTLYDLSPLEHPEWFKPSFAAWYRLFLPRLVRRVQCVITLSEHVRVKILSRFDLPGDRVVVIPAGVDTTRFHQQKPPTGTGRYLLFVGSLEPRKNLSVLLAAWEQIEPQHPDVSIVLAGVTGRVFRHFKFPTNIPRVQFAGYVPDEALPALYAGADLFVLPSFDEGFGLPVLEAMACGTPVVASTGGALPEVVGDAGLLVDPQDPVGLAKVLNDCLVDADLRRSFSEQGQKRALNYSWQASSEKLWQVLRGVGGR